MAKILIFYYSKTGNTEMMAKAIAQGARKVQGVEVRLTEDVEPYGLAEFDAIIFGIPTYHNDMPPKVKKLFEKIEENKIDLKGKIGAVFGSHGWSGEAPRIAAKIMKENFGMEIAASPLLIEYTPNSKGLKRCKDFGRKLAELVARQ